MPLGGYSIIFAHSSQHIPHLPHGVGNNKDVLHDSLGPWMNTMHQRWDWKISWDTDTGDIINVMPTGLNEYYSFAGGHTRMNQVYRWRKISNQALPADVLPCSVQIL